MSEATVYLVALVVLAAVALFLGRVVWLQTRDLGHLRRRNANLVRLHGRQRAWIRHRRAQVRQYRRDLAELAEACDRHVGEVDAIVKAVQFDPREVFAVSVEADLAALEVAEPTPASAPEPAPAAVELPAAESTPVAEPPPRPLFGLAIYPRPARREENR